MVKVSIIVPIYNVEHYLSKCLDSLVQQTLQDIEIICINDGSPDNSQQIIENYRQQYPQLIKSYYQTNQGLSAARNYGMTLAQGEFIAFVDSDDWVSVDLYEKMYHCAKKYQAQIVHAPIIDIYESNGQQYQGGFKVVDQPTNFQQTPQILFDIAPVAWDKIYARELIIQSNIRFPVGLKYEDVGTVPIWLMQATTIASIQDSYYYYLQRTTSITKNHDLSILDKIQSIHQVMTYSQQHHLFVQYKEEFTCFLVHHLLLGMIDLVHGLPQHQRHQAIKALFDYVLMYNRQWLKNRYLRQEITMKRQQQGLVAALRYQLFLYRTYYQKGMNWLATWRRQDKQQQYNQIEVQQQRQQQEGKQL